jgi:hypothetical protein
VHAGAADCCAEAGAADKDDLLNEVALAEKMGTELTLASAAAATRGVAPLSSSSSISSNEARFGRLLMRTSEHLQEKQTIAKSSASKQAATTTTK